MFKFLPIYYKTYCKTTGSIKQIWLFRPIWLFRITEIFLGFLGRCVRPKRRNITISVKEYKRYTAETAGARPRTAAEQVFEPVPILSVCFVCFYRVSSGL